MPIVTDPLSLLFAGCFLFGLLFFIVTALLGSFSHGHSGHTVDAGHLDHVGHIGHATHHIHVGGHGHTHGAKGAPSAKGVSTAHTSAMALYGYVNPTSVVLFLMGFGFFGYVFHNSTPLALPLTLAFALGGGCLIAALLLAFIARIFGDSEGSTVQDVSERVGLLGKVNSTIRENELGEVLYVSPGGMRKTIPARSVDGRRFERGQEVVVVNVQRGIAEVDTWDHFLNEGGDPTLSSQSAGFLKAPNLDQQAEMEELRRLLEQPEPEADSHSTIQKDM